MASPHVFGTVTVILGSEQLLAERAEAKIVTAAKAHHAQMQTFELAGATATPADFLEATSGSLFAPETTVIINDGESASADLATAIVDFAMNPSP